MAVIEVQFNRILVHKDGDGWPQGKGEIYYQLGVDGDIVVDVPRNQHVSANDGDTIRINQTHVITRPDHPGSHFVIHGSVAEADGKFTFQDDKAGIFNISHGYDTGWRPGSKSVRLGGRGVDVTVYYTIIVRPS
jgi:hypothetical protein